MEIVVYSKATCPFCILLKMELAKRGLRFTEVDLSDEAKRLIFYDNSGTKTVPQVFLTDQPYSDTAPSGLALGGWSEVSKDWSRLEVAT